MEAGKGSQLFLSHVRNIRVHLGLSPNFCDYNIITQKRHDIPGWGQQCGGGMWQKMRSRDPSMQTTGYRSLPSTIRLRKAPVFGK